MSIFFMSGKPFINEYLDENPNKILRTQFVIVSSIIRKTGKYEKQIINANHALYPPQELLLDYDDYKKNEEYHAKYKEFLKDSNPLLATLIKYAIEEDSLIVFLCSEKEKKYHYLKLIHDYILEEFGYEIYDYKKLKSGKLKIKKCNESEVLEKCKKVIKKAKKHQKENMLSTEHGRETYFGNMSKKKVIKKLKKNNLYDETMSSSDMRELLNLIV